jgi:putative transposase
MRKSKFSEHQIIAILKAVEAGWTVRDVCREHEISDATYYQWKSQVRRHASVRYQAPA